VKTTLLTIRTGSEPSLTDLTAACAQFVDGEGDGLLNVFVPHATAGLVIVELVDDLLEPQFLGLVEDDEQQFVMMIRDRMLGGEQRPQSEVAAIGHAV